MCVDKEKKVLIPFLFVLQKKIMEVEANVTALLENMSRVSSKISYSVCSQSVSVVR